LAFAREHDFLGQKSELAGEPIAIFIEKYRLGSKLECEKVMNIVSESVHSVQKVGG
jgi:hypothetical protein